MNRHTKTKSSANAELLYIRNSNFLTFGELRSTTSALESVLLSFLHTRVSGEESSCLKSRTIVLVSGYESTSYAVTDSTCLPGEATTVYVSNDVELALYNRH